MRYVYLLIIFFALSQNLSAREDTILDDGWRFKLGEADGAEGWQLKDQFWQTVSLPHCWGWEDAQNGRDYYQGPGWYRHALNLRPETGKSYFLRCEAAGSVAEVYVNGKRVGEHRGFGGAFCFDITSLLSVSGTNLLALRVSNAPQRDIAPLSADFPVYGGLYRPVHLIVTSDVHLALTDHASPGVAWQQSRVTDTQALLDVTAEVANDTSQQEPLKLVARILDETGKQVAESEQEIKAAARTTSPYWLQVIVPEPHLWNGVLDPYLYRAVVELRSTNGMIDSVEQPLGLRYYSVDPNKGFFLNGKPYSLHGVSRHQDRPDKGWALSAADEEEDINLIKEMGATCVRCPTYQHSEHFYSLCDQAGILVWAEIPQVDQIDASPEFAETSRNQLLDLIRQNLDHPAIFVWSLYNELRAGYPDPQRELQDLNMLAHAEDPSRPTIGATCLDTMPMPQVSKIPDLLGWNIYSGWYDPPYGTLKDFGAQFDLHRYDSRSGGICISEYGAGANITQHEQNPGKPKTDDQWHPEEWQNEVHEAAWAAIKSHPFVWASFAWNMFDFTSYWRNEGGVPGRNDKGLVTYDRKTRKDAFYFYKANWTETPVLYITSRRFLERTNAMTDVKIYANARRVELFVNGKSQGIYSKATDCVFIWKDVHLAPGENRIQARATFAATNLTDQCVWDLKTASQ